MDLEPISLGELKHNELVHSKMDLENHILDYFSMYYP